MTPLVIAPFYNRGIIFYTTGDISILVSGGHYHFGMTAGFEFFFKFESFKVTTLIWVKKSTNRDKENFNVETYFPDLPSEISKSICLQR